MTPRGSRRLLSRCYVGPPKIKIFFTARRVGKGHQRRPSELGREISGKRLEHVVNRPQTVGPDGNSTVETPTDPGERVKQHMKECEG